ncbi:respiratory chain complex I subunit 1 family protein [Roseomonas sp. 18066]|uniref:respiratory chain complex I subunit 1 family protein n=1 Tax=Roseomonas sp. 18066 TaxID=2681412 RepID=UPI00135B623C|nr:NADH-quinone oxidoreductase subunit H [Roseomonas sp. 18066]
MTLLAGVVAQLLHLLLMLALAPLLLGCIRILEARLVGRRGPPLLQPWRDLLKLLKKRPVLAENASVVSAVTPYVGLAATLVAASLVPGFARDMALSPLADLLLVVGLLAIARCALALAALDIGSGLGGLGAARAMSFAAFAEPAFLLAVMGFAMLAGSTNLDAIGLALQEGAPGPRISLGLALVALLAVALVENGRVPLDQPLDHPAGAPAVTLLQGAMLLEASGRHLALWQMTAALRLTLWLALLAALFLPFGMAPADSGPLAWMLGLAVWLPKLLLLALLLAVFESAIARMRVFRVPEFLGAALLLALLGLVFLFLSTGLA